MYLLYADNISLLTRALNFQNSSSRCPLMMEWSLTIRWSQITVDAAIDIICRSADFQLKVENPSIPVGITFSLKGFCSAFPRNAFQIPKVKAENWRFKLSTVNSSTTRSSTSFFKDPSRERLIQHTPHRFGCTREYTQGKSVRQHDRGYPTESSDQKSSELALNLKLLKNTVPGLRSPIVKHNEFYISKGNSGGRLHWNSCSECCNCRSSELYEMCWSRPAKKCCWWELSHQTSSDRSFWRERGRCQRPDAFLRWAAQPGKSSSLSVPV